MAENLVLLNTLANLHSNKRVKSCFYFVVGPHADEQNLSEKVPVICQGEKPSPAAQRHHKGTL